MIGTFKKILIVFGTRPEAIKMCPVVQEFKNRAYFDVKVCSTGQHDIMLDQVLKIFRINPDYNLNIMQQTQTLFDITTAVLNKIQYIMQVEKPDIVLVHGDTTTSFTTALAAFYNNIPVGHVEAGLRTYDLQQPYPEEFNRQAISIIAKYNFAPTLQAKTNLEKKSNVNTNTYVVGNTVIDALKTTVQKDFNSNELEWAKDHKLIFLTMHRRENWGKPMFETFKALRQIVDEHKDIKLLYPVHLNPVVQKVAKEILSNHERIKLCKPIDVVRCHNIMAKSYLILTDSGGIQEEAPSLNIPVLVLRNKTERPEGLEANTLILAGNSFKKVYNNVSKLLTNQKLYSSMQNAKNPFGDGLASKRIADILETGKYDEFYSCPP